MAIKADFHMHSHNSGDSTASMESMVLAAIKNGLNHICFTEHYDPDFVYKPGQEEIFTLNTDSYLYELLQMKSKYAEQIKILFGVELGLQPHIKKELAVYSKSHDFDFIIGSCHLCNRKDPYDPSFFEGRSEDEAHHEYFQSVLDTIKKTPYFDVFGHLDYVVRYGPTKNDQYTYAKHKDVIDEILSFLIEEEKGLELNTGGFRHGLNDANPCIDILKRYRELGGEIITIGSDAHEPADVASNFDKATEILTACGFKYYSIFEGRSPELFRI